MPGLLVNWGRGLLAMAQQAQVQAGVGSTSQPLEGGCRPGRWAAGAAVTVVHWPPCERHLVCSSLATDARLQPPHSACPSTLRPSLCTQQELALAVSLLDEAARRLEQSAAFQRGSTDPLLALGDVLLERGEKLAAAGDGAGAAAALQRALSDGYHAARRISSSSPEAAVGEADVHVQLARLAMAAGNGEAAAEQWALAEAAYALALRQPTAFDWSERCEARYNHACCLARCGRAGEAAALLRQVVASGAVNVQDVQADADLAGVAL